MFFNDHATTRVFVEGDQLLAYAWKSATLAEMDIIRSLVAIGREFKFPLDCIADDINIDVPKAGKLKDAIDLIFRLDNCCEVYKVFIDEHRTIHREYVNARRPDSFLFDVGDILWVRRQIKSNNTNCTVGKLHFKHTCSWEITKIVAGG